MKTIARSFAPWVAGALMVLVVERAADANVISNMNTGAVFPTIQLAHDAAHLGDTLFVYPGEHLEWGITITNGITLTGGSPSTTILQAWPTPTGAVDRVLQVHAGTLTVRVENLTIRYGCRTNVSEAGGGIWVGSGATTISNCVITANRAYDGGGVAGAYYAGNATLLSCVVTNNRANGYAGGGAIGIIAYDSLFDSNFADCEGGGVCVGALTRCTIRGNRSDCDGGGVCDTLLVSCLVEDNSTASEGGGVAGGPGIFGCLVRNNTGYVGGGIALADAYGCTFMGNHSTHDGAAGAYYDFYSCLMISNRADYWGGGVSVGTLHHCTVIGNSAGMGGGGLFYCDAEGCIIVSNQAPTGPNISDFDGSRIVTHCLVLPGGYPGAGNLAVDPRFADAASGDYHLRVDSPCIDAGVALTGTDLDGQPRLQGSYADMGAYEYPAVCVAQGGSHTPPFETWVKAATNLQAGVNAASNDFLVLVSNGSHVCANEWRITNRVFVRSLYGPEVTSVDGQNARRCLVATTNAIVQGLSFTNGRADSGAGVYLSDNATLRSCVVARCYATNYGGGVFFGAGGGTVEHSVVRGNIATNHQGGGIYARAGDVIRNCLIHANWSKEGGGVLTYQGGLIENCTIVGNVSLIHAGGGVRLYQGGEVRNSIVYGNVAPGDTNISVVTPAGTVTYSCTRPAFAGAGNITNDPLFRAADDFRLAFASPCRNEGLFTNWMTNAADLDGHARVIETDVDLGAYEFAIAYVAPTGSHTAPFDTWARAGTNLQSVLEGAVPGALVRVAEGTYRADTNHPAAATACAVVTNIFEIEAVGAQSSTVLDGEGARRGLAVFTNATVRGFTVTNGYTAGAGGGVYLAGGGALVSCVVARSTAGTYGGGVFLSYTGRILQCVARENEAQANDGGGIYLSNGGRVDRTTVISNRSRHGAGLYADGNGVIRNTLVVGNQSVADGGGVHLYGTGNLLEHVTVSGNAARDGGGLYCINAANTVRNSIVYGNSVTRDGPEWWGAAATWQYNCTVPSIGTHCITSPPGFLNPAAGDYHLGGGSSLDDEGMTLASVTNDLDGLPRPLDGKREPSPEWDMGAYEYMHPLGDSDGDGMPDGWEHQYYGNPLAGDPLLDEDLDGSPNLDESIANMNPHAATSVFAVVQLAVSNGIGSVVVPTWSSRIYYMEVSTNPAVGSSWTRSSPMQAGNDGLKWLTATNNPANAMHRVQVWIP